MDTVSKDDVIAWLGRARYETEMHSPRQFISPTDSTRRGGEEGNVPPDNDFTWDVTDHIMSLAISSEAKMELLLDILRDVPSYTQLLAINMHWSEFDEPARLRFWQFVVSELSQESSILEGAIDYSLGVDFFEDYRTREEAWRALVMHPARNPTLIRRVFAGSSWIPIAWHEALYEELIGDEQWDQVILHDLFENRKEYRNAEDKVRGWAILKRLKVAKNSPEFVELERQFGIDEEQRS